MSERHVLKSDGAWVELRDVHDLRARDRKKVSAAMTTGVSFDLDTGRPTMTDPTRVMEAFQNDVPEAIAALLISTWEIPYLPDAKIPSIDPEILGELRLDDYDRLIELIEPARALLLPNSSTDPDDYADPASPSEPASA
jgi:hypothetical protein